MAKRLLAAGYPLTVWNRTAVSDLARSARSCLPAHHVIAGLPGQSAIAGPGG
jgi:3-hydroxyisobutyrate dehydrogenase-like beta-hydroxyacid dehydrogenase